VIDLPHGWTEIHPVWSIEVLNWIIWTAVKEFVERKLAMDTSAAQLEKSQSNRRVPGPPLNLLGIGSLGLMLNPLHAVTADFARYGDVVKYRLFNLTAYLLAHPDHVSHVLHDNHSNYTKANFDYERLKQLLGEGLLTSEGPQWLRQRRLIQPLFHRQQIAQWAGMMTANAMEMLEGWKTFAAERRAFDVSAQMMTLTLRIVGEALLSIDISSEAGQITRALSDAQDHFGHFRLGTLLPFLPTAENRRFRAALQTLDRIVRKIIDDRRHETSARNNLLAKLMAARDAETGLPLYTDPRRSDYTDSGRPRNHLQRALLDLVPVGQKSRR